MEAYDQLSSLLSDFVRFLDNLGSLTRSLNNIKYAGDAEDKLLANIAELNDMKENISKYKDQASVFYHFIYHFNLRFGHVFKYDFGANEFKELENSVTAYKNSIYAIHDWIGYFGQTVPHISVETVPL